MPFVLMQLTFPHAGKLITVHDVGSAGLDVGRMLLVASWPSRRSSTSPSRSAPLADSRFGSRTGAALLAYANEIHSGCGP